MAAIGQLPHRFNVTLITNALPCEVTTDLDHEYATDDFVRLTDLNGGMPIKRGEDPLNNKRWQIIVTGTTTFTLKHPVTHIPVNSTSFTPYVTGGYCNLIENNFYYNGE